MTIDASTLQLGKASELPRSPEEARLDRVPNPHAGTDYLALCGILYANALRKSLELCENIVLLRHLPVYWNLAIRRFGL